MANPSVPQLSLINQEIHARESLSAYLSQAEALAYIALGDHFLENPESIIHDYFWALGDIIEKARELNELSLTILLHQTALGDLKQAKEEAPKKE